MIKSITFKEGGYITEQKDSILLLREGKQKLQELIKKEGEDFVSTLSEDGLIRYAKMNRGKDYRLKKKPLNPHLYKTLLNRTFEFAPDKVNIIFGPNASGKSTIIKSLAGFCGCGSKDNLDGWTSCIFLEPFDFHRWFDEPKDTDEYTHFYQKRLGILKNNVDVVWDGIPVYNDNFSNRHSYGSLGDMCGSIFGDDERDSFLQEIAYTIGKERISLGQNSMFIFNKVIGVVKQHFSLETLQQISDKKKKRVNDSWERAYDFNMKFYQDLYDKNFDSSIGELNTVMFDELDKSLDIENTAYVYRELLPKLMGNIKAQMIIVSHSPLVLTDEVFNNKDAYNIISMDEEYTERCRKNLKNFSFC